MVKISQRILDIPRNSKPMRHQRERLGSVEIYKSILGANARNNNFLECNFLPLTLGGLEKYDINMHIQIFMSTYI